MNNFIEKTKILYNSILGFSPYHYQETVANHLLNGKNVILCVPTGAGKTWASIMPFLYAKQNNLKSFPQKMIYSLPLRTLANSIYTDVNKVIETNKSFEGLASIQTGEYKNDAHFESDIIFSTIDQTLSSFLCFPLSLSKRQANINAGALIGSYLVFDEFHLLDSKLSMSTTIGVLKILDNLCRYCIMSATLSDEYIKLLSDELNAEIVKIDDFPEDRERISSIKIPEGKEFKKTIKVLNNTINANEIGNHHKEKTIVICNRVEKAQKIFNNLIELYDNRMLKGVDKENIICLHSRFFDKDRKAKEEKLKVLFGKENEDKAILVSTQVIEAGMDISCDTMHVEISPINSFLQRVGRCARWEGDSGEIYVYDVLELEELDKLNIEPANDEEKKQIKAINNKYLPYNKDLCNETLLQLKTTNYLNKDIAQGLVNNILTLKELMEFESIQRDDFNKKKIKSSWEYCEKSMYSETIRNIESIEVAIIDFEKEKSDNFYPYKFETIGLYKWSFIKWIKEIFKKIDIEEKDVVFIATKESESNIIDFDTLDSDNYILTPVYDIEKLKSHYDVVFVDKSIFKYTHGSGVEIGNGKICSPIKQTEKKKTESFIYRKDTFFQHNQAIINCYESEFKPKLDFVFEQLNEYWEEEIDWDMLIKAMICLHDYGKLNKNWQWPMKKLQELKDQKEKVEHNSNEVLAHTDFNPVTDKDIEIESGSNKKPAHAGVGAYVILELLSDYYKDKRKIKNILFPLASAIMKHHSPITSSFSDFNVSSYIVNEFKKIWINQVGFPVVEPNHLKSMKSIKIDKYLINSESDNVGILTYFLLVRILRLCDQKATENIDKYLKR